MLRAIFALLLMLGTAGCTPKCPEGPITPAPEEPSPYCYDGTPKPRLALIPFVDSSGCYVPWHIDQELTSTLRCQLISDGCFYVLPEAEVNAYAKGLQPRDLFSPDLSFAKQFCSADYLVALDLFEHAAVPFEREKVSACFPAQANRCSTMLQIKLRLRVIDLTCECPRVVLQEIFTYNSIVPKASERIDYERLRWGTEGFASTPIGEAHRRLISDLSCRIENVVKGIN